MIDHELERRKRVAWANARPTSQHGVCIDCDGREIHWAQYGQLTFYGWEIDHAAPLALGGSDADSNLRARHWHGNRSAGGLLAR